jgi:peptidoglycan/xylan/chitin deacetylase (PgdA/CDA1 family)
MLAITLLLPATIVPLPHAAAAGAPVNLAASGGGIVFTFDGGYASHVQAAAILQDHGQRGTFYVMSQFLHVGPWYADYLAPSDLVNLTRAGHDVESHTVTHADLTTLNASQLGRELADSKAALQAIVGRPVVHVAYPFGATSDAVVAAAQGPYASGRTVTGSVNDFLLPTDAYRLPGLMVTQATTLAAAKGYVDFAAAHNVTVVLDFQAIKTSPGAYDWTPGDLDALSGYVAARNVTARTMTGLFGAPPPIAPAAPTLSGSAGNGSVSLTWTAPPGDGGSPIVGYTVSRSTVSGNETTLATLGNVTSYTDAAVANGWSYHYKVSARNAAGAGAGSNEVRLVPRAASMAGPGALVLTFDDGYASHDYASKVLDAHGFKGTFFITTGFIVDTGDANPESLTPAQVADIARRGHDTEAHTLTHRDLTTLTAARLERELALSQLRLQNMTGQPVRHMAYPFGALNPTVEAAAARHYSSARTMQTLLSGGPLTLNGDRYDVPALGVGRGTSNLSVAKSYVDQAIATNQTFILVFHRIVVNADGSDWDPADFVALMDYVQQRHVLVQTYAQYLGS